jgi:Uncharacterized protein conserved in bacteria (DUF2332)
MTIASMYAEFAVREARGISPTNERLSLSVAGDEEILELLDTVPPAKRQPNLLLGVVRFLGGPVDEPAAFHDFTVANWPAVEAGLRTRATQTNEAGRCALLLPVLASLPLVFHTSVLYQVPQARRAAFVDQVRELPGHWIAVEAPDVLTYERLPPPPDQALHNVLALDGTPLAWTRAHGQAMAWFA